MGLLWQLSFSLVHRNVFLLNVSLSILQTALLCEGSKSYVGCYTLLILRHSWYLLFIGRPMKSLRSFLTLTAWVEFISPKLTGSIGPTTKIDNLCHVPCTTVTFRFLFHVTSQLGLNNPTQSIKRGEMINVNLCFSYFAWRRRPYLLYRLYRLNQSISFPKHMQLTH